MKRSKVGFLARVGLVAVASLFTVCKATGVGSGGDIASAGTKAVEAPKLVSLDLRFASGDVNLVRNFSPDQTAYAVNLSSEDAGKSLKVTEAKAEEEADTLIKVGEDVLQIGGLLSPPAGAAKVISISVSRGELSTLYTVTILPPADYYSYSLASLHAVYTGTSVNQIQNFDAEVVNYSFNADAAHANGSVNITAIPSSQAASLSIQVRGESPFPDEHTVSVDLPPAGVYRFVDITVTSPESTDAGQGGSRVYTVTILGYQPSTATWTATVSGAPLTITAVTMFDNSPAQIAIAMQERSGGSFEAATALNYNGKTFVVSMTDGDTSYSTRALSPAISGATGGNRSVSLDLNGVAYGRTISNDTELYNLSLPENSAESWSVIADITLPGATWLGPTGFTGKLYGNGHTIDLPLSKTSGSMAMFESVNPGAGIYDLTLNVHTPEGGLYLTGYTAIGGFVGFISCTPSSSITLANLKVTGSVLIKHTGIDALGGHVVIGGIAANIGFSGTQAVSIKSCVSELDVTIDLDASSTSTGNTWAIGGFVGEFAGNNVVISDSYSTGSINITMPTAITAGGNMSVGGFVGQQRNNTVGQVNRIERCYTTAEVSVNRNLGSSGDMSVGGMVGWFASSRADCGIHSCVALGPAVSVSWTGGTGTLNTGRIVGRSTTILSGNYVVTGTAGGDPTSKDGGDVVSAATVPWEALGFTADNGWDTSVTPPVLR